VIAERKTCVVTGATSGIGKATALSLGRLGFDLILVGRSELKGVRIADRINAKPGAGRAEFLRTDLSVQRQVHQLAQSIIDRYERLDVLINNAGARFDAYEETEDGIERTFALNHLGHFLLTGLLIDRLARAPSARVITVSSGSHSGIAPGPDWCLLPGNYNRSIAYGKSKLANVMFSYELGRRLHNTRITSNAVDPGGVASRFARNNGLKSWVRHLAYHALKRDLTSPKSAAKAIVYLATSPDVECTTGEYFCGGRFSRSSPESYDEAAAQLLWKLSIDMTGLDPCVVESRAAPSGATKGGKT
jgi:NAD(P)-dependent dehydrogenase (short-subunit alcohol dehydrogenase family)